MLAIHRRSCKKKHAVESITVTSQDDMVGLFTNHAQSIDGIPASDALINAKKNDVHVEQDDSDDNQNIQVRTGQFHNPAQVIGFVTSIL